MTHRTDLSRPTSRGRLGTAVIGLALSALALSACGVSSKDSTASGANSPSVSSSAASSGTASRTIGADGTLTATEAEYSISLGGDTVAAGPYLVKVVNNGNATHDLVVEQNGNKIAGTSSIAPGESASLSVTLKPGDYVFYCSIGNHRAMGMEKTVHVK